MSAFDRDSKPDRRILDAPRKPRPAFLPGDRIKSEGSLPDMIVKAVNWRDGWIYRAEPEAAA